MLRVLLILAAAVLVALALLPDVITALTWVLAAVGSRSAGTATAWGTTARIPDAAA